MGVTPEVIEEPFGPSERRFAVDDPAFPCQRAEPFPQSGRGGQCFELGRKLQLARAAKLGEAFQELRAKHLAQGAYGKEKPPAGRDPAIAVGGQSSAGHEGMDVEVATQLLVPGVQDHL